MLSHQGYRNMRVICQSRHLMVEREKFLPAAFFGSKAGKQTFTTVPQDHGNCSVGSVTHGLKTLSEVANNSDVLSLLECGWVTKDVVMQLPVVKERPEFITYGPLDDSSINPDVILLFINAMQAMILLDAIRDIRIEGKHRNAIS